MSVRLDKKWLIGGGIGAVILIVLVLVAWQAKSINIPLVSEGNSVAQAPSDAGGHPVAESPEPDLQRCVNLWNNSSANAGPRSSLSALEASYISITTSEVYPDKCLITAANPEINLSAQFLEGDGSPYAYDQVGSGSASSLPPSVTDWNAASDAEGHVALSDGSRGARY